MAQIGKDYYEDLTAESFAGLIDAFARGDVPQPGPQNGRFASEPRGGLTSLKGKDATERHNASVALALALGDTVARITGEPGKTRPAPARTKPQDAPEAEEEPVPATMKYAASHGVQPTALTSPREGAADDLKKIKGVGPRLEQLLHSMGFFHFDQIAGWTAEEIVWVDENLEGFKGRVTRDGWVEQARLLAAGQETEFSQRVDKGEVY
jgi:NADH-quinone oxidoreductase subunit E